MKTFTSELALEFASPPASKGLANMIDELRRFQEFGKQTIEQLMTSAGGVEVPVFVNEFWTSRQRAAHSLHEVSYRACFKPQVPRFFIERLTEPGSLVYDPFMGRGTTLVEAMLLGRRAAGCDINPVSRILTAPRLNPPTVEQVEERLGKINFDWREDVRKDLEVFYHPETLRQLTALRHHFLQPTADSIDEWIRMVATNRLTGHSSGFFSVYTLPPNQAVSVESQRRINAQRQQEPEKRDVPALILKKTRQLLSEIEPHFTPEAGGPIFINRSCDQTPELSDESVDLVVTSPPFLDTVDYAQDNWLRAWFCSIDLDLVPIWQLRSIGQWTSAMTRVFRELHRVLRPNGTIAFEVGEVRNGKVQLEKHAMDAGIAAGLIPVLVLINDQIFTKTANCWGVSNNAKGTNTNRVIIFRK